MLNGSSLACTKKNGLSENGSVLNGSSLACTKKKWIKRKWSSAEQVQFSLHQKNMD